jgi:hypothetical protein
MPPDLSARQMAAALDQLLMWAVVTAWMNMALSALVMSVGELAV